MQQQAYSVLPFQYMAFSIEIQEKSVRLRGAKKEMQI